MTNELVRFRDFLLVKSARGGDGKAFAKLMSFYKNRVYMFGMGFFRNEADSDDFVQDVFIKVYTHLASFKGNSMFSTWLMRIAYTTAVNSVKRRKEYLPLADEELLISGDLTPEDREIRKATADAIHEAVKGLPEKYSLCLDLYFSYDIPYQEISEMTDLPVNTIKSHIFRAKKLLRKKLEEIK